MPCSSELIFSVARFLRAVKLDSCAGEADCEGESGVGEDGIADLETSFEELMLNEREWSHGRRRLVRI